MGDDPGAKSSSIAHQSEHAMIHCGIPVLNPSSVQDYLDLGLYGWALSRYSGCWVGFKCLTDTIESSGSVSVSPDRVRIVVPTDYQPPASGLHIGWAEPAAAGRGAPLRAPPRSGPRLRPRQSPRPRGGRGRPAPSRHRHDRQGLRRSAPGPRGASVSPKRGCGRWGSRSTRWRCPGPSSPNACGPSPRATTTCSSSRRSGP